jgi:nucleoside-diphosphate-sugar epimerase
MTLPPVLVTGAGGFIGRALVETLHSLGCEVIAVRDVFHDQAWSGAARGCSAVVHLANIAHARANAAELERVNVRGTRKAAEHAIAAGVPRFVYLSSIKVHGEESPPGGFSARSPINPADAYGQAKARAEEALLELARDRELRLTILRPPLVYGPRVKANFLALTRAIARGVPLPLASVQNRRSLVYVGNVVDAILRCLQRDAPAGRAYILSDGAAVSTPELCRELGKALGRPARLFAFPPALLETGAALLGRRASALSLTRNLEVDDSDSRRDLAWQPPYTFFDGLQATAAWFRSAASK